MSNLLLDVLLTGSFLAYGGRFRFELRQDLIKKWMLKLKESGVTCTSDF
jgi:hypothetical protein